MKIVPLLIVALSFCAAPALADIPPGPDYVESCTLDKQVDSDTCESCGAFHGDPTACQKRFEAKGWVHRCQTRGASVWTEIWCAPKSATSTKTKAADTRQTPKVGKIDGQKAGQKKAPITTAPKTQSCDLAAGGDLWSAIASLTIAGFAWVLLRRRSA